jgi:hypothetical protein
MKNKIGKLIVCMIFLVLITSVSVGSLSTRGISTNVGDPSFSVSNLSTQDMFWPGNSDEWAEVAPETQGLNSSKIAEMFEFIEDNSYDIHSVTSSNRGISMGIQNISKSTPIYVFL